MEGETVDHLGTTYDYGSVMHYSETAFAIDDSQNTITPHDPDAEIGQREALSSLDIERVQILYGCLAIVSNLCTSYIFARYVILKGFYVFQEDSSFKGLSMDEIFREA